MTPTTTWPSAETLSVLPDPVAASLHVIGLQLGRYAEAVRAGHTNRALGEALNLQRECARLGDWAQLAGYHQDRRGLSAGGAQREVAHG